MAAPGGSNNELTASRALARQRHEVILTEIRQRGAVRVTELAAQLGVSDMTIRRDLDSLAEAGLIEKVHGGATALTDRAPESGDHIVRRPAGGLVDDQQTVDPGILRLAHPATTWRRRGEFELW